MSFNFSEVKDSGNAKKFVGYGINDDVTIVSVESGVTDKSVDYLDIKFKITGDEDENATRIREFLSEKGTEYVMRKLLQVNNAVAKKEALTGQNFSSTDEMASKLNALWSGRRLRLKLSGEEYEGVDAAGEPKIKTRVKMPLFSFTEAIMEGAEYPVVTETKLEFNKNSEYDFKKMVQETNLDAAPTDGGGLPF